MKIHDICVLGGTGFVGGHLVGALARQQHRIRVLTRRRENHRDLLVLPTVEIVEADAHDVRQLAEQFAGCDTVINLVGILNEGRRGRSFQNAHVELPRKVVEACGRAGVQRLLHMSALNADASRGPSAYLRSKGQGEDLVHASEGLAVTSFRPSVIFGPGDSFFNRFAALLRLAPVMPLAGAYARFAPVYVGDVAHCYVSALDDKRTFGQRYDLCGPHQYTLKQLVEFTAHQMGACRLVVGLGPGMSARMAGIMEWLPGPPLTRDNVRSMAIDSVCHGPFPEVFDLQPASIEAIVPRYLGSGGKEAIYQSFRRGARRD